jgi:hypothetical protein
MSRHATENGTPLGSRRSLIVATGKYHGLGNRIRTVLGGEVLARLEGRTFAYTWPTGAQFGASFDELWEYDRMRLPALVSRALAWPVPYRDGSLEWLNDDVRQERVWQIKTAHGLRLPASSPWEDELHALRPVREVRQRVSEIFDSRLSDRPFIGVMVRAHANSHAETLRHSPVEWYSQRMREIQGLWPEVAFFISADTVAALDRLMREFPHSVSQVDKGAYNSKKALLASVADLYLLASSSHILAPHYSSFPELAQRMAGPTVGLETSQNAVALPSLAAATRVDNPLQPFRRRRL